MDKFVVPWRDALARLDMAGSPRLKFEPDYRAAGPPRMHGPEGDA